MSKKQSPIWDYSQVRKDVKFAIRASREASIF